VFDRHVAEFAASGTCQVKLSVDRHGTAYADPQSDENTVLVIVDIPLPELGQREGIDIVHNEGFGGTAR
jgi:hypothetical protein